MFRDSDRLRFGQEPLLIRPANESSSSSVPSVDGPLTTTTSKFG